MSLERFTCGFIPLVDCAALVVAKEIGFAAEEGIDLVLHRETSWSNIRDKVALGLLDAAQMLTPMPIAMTLGLSRFRKPIIAPMLLSVNGNVVGVSRRIGRSIAASHGSPFFEDPVAAAAALRDAMEGRPFKVGVPWPFSMHTLLLQYWLGRCGFDLKRDVSLVVAPPPFMAEALSAGEIDFFCVGEPWGSVAVEEGVAEILLTGSSIWRCAPEKALGLRAETAEDRSEALDALLRALWRAARWASADGHAGAVAELLADDAYVARPAELIERSLRGVLTVGAGGEMRRIPGMLTLFEGAAPFPWRSQAGWIAERYEIEHRLGAEDRARAEAVFRPDILRRALAPLGADLPGASAKLEGALAEPTPVGSTQGELSLGPDVFFDGARFDPSG